jgi:DNA-binding IclR family transcriptional regulator
MPKPSPHNYKANTLLYLLSKGDEWTPSKEIVDALGVQSQSLGSIMHMFCKAGLVEQKDASLSYEYYTKTGKLSTAKRMMKVWRLTAKGRKAAEGYK